jgi:hypothetical protein
VGLGAGYLGSIPSPPANFPDAPSSPFDSSMHFPAASLKKGMIMVGKVITMVEMNLIH